MAPIVLGALAAVGAPTWAAQEAEGARPAERALLEPIAKILKAWARDPVILADVRTHNAKRLTLEEIQRLDQAWVAGGVPALVQAVLDSPCSQRLRKLVSSHPAYVEAFAMGDQGATVCMSTKTSDYWQGDEAKWQNSYAGGRGTVFIDKARYDESARMLLSQVSVPVLDGQRVVGALTVGIRIEALSVGLPTR